MKCYVMNKITPLNRLDWQLMMLKSYKSKQTITE